MPTINRTTSGMIAPSTATIQARIDALRSAFTQGNTITADQINELNGMFTYFNDHYHSVDNDLFGIQDYGNVGGGYSSSGSYDGAKNTGTMIDARGLQGNQNDGGPGGVNVGDTITADYHNALRTMFVAANGHYHTIDDRTS
jgi:hypothetical protein